MERWICKVCGYVHDGPMEEGFLCPRCKHPASAFERIEDRDKANPYAGTQTEQNLRDAFSGESEARNKYTYFAMAAQREGYEQIAEIFMKTARNEQEHAMLWFEALGGIGDMRPICSVRRRAKIMNGRICMPALRRMPIAKAFMNSPSVSAAWRPWRKRTRSAIANC